VVEGGGPLTSHPSPLLVELAETLGVPVIPTLMGWGTIPDDHPLMAGMVGLQTSHRYGNATFRMSDFVLGIGNRWANRHTGSVEKYMEGRKFVHIDIEPTQIGRVFPPDLGIVSDAGAALEMLVAIARERKAAGTLRDYGKWVASCQHRKSVMLRKTHYDEVPLKPQRVYEEMNRHFGRDTIYVTTIGLSQIAGAQFLHVYEPRHWINCGQAGPLGWTLPAALGVRAALPDAKIVGLSGDYDFQFMLEELAVGAQHKLPFLQVVVNNSYLGLIRQSQRGFEMDFEVSLAFDNINVDGDGDAPAGYGVDHCAVAEGLGCKAVRIKSPNEFAEGFAKAEALMKEHQVPVVLEFILERVTNVAMGTEIDAINEFEEVLCLDPNLSLERPVDMGRDAGKVPQPA
jgi:tartronate-semialdehyde synthase